MIKFRYIIHKESRFVLTYDRWLQHFNEFRNKDIILSTKFENSKYESENNIQSISHSEFSYGITDILTSDDFEIIYESDFTKEELEQLRDISHKISNPFVYKEAFEKVRSLFIKEWELESKYGIREK